MFSDSDNNISLNDEVLEDITMPDLLDQTTISDNTYPSSTPIHDKTNNLSNTPEFTNSLTDLLHERSIDNTCNVSLTSIQDKTCDFSNTLDLTNNLLNDISLPRSTESNIQVSKRLENEIRNFKALQKDVNNAKVRCKKSKLTMEVMDKVFNSSYGMLERELQEKCSRKLKYNKLLNTFRDNDVPEFLNDVNSRINFTETEKEKIHAVIKSVLSKEISELKAEQEVFSELLDRNSQEDLVLPRNVLTETKATILSLTEKISNAVQSCSEELNKVTETITEICQLRRAKFKELYVQDVECLENKIKLLALQMKNLNYMVEASITQHENLSDAATLLLEELNRNMDEACYSLEKLKSKEMEYQKLEGTKFKDILHEFIELRESYKKKCWALRHLQKAL